MKNKKGFTLIELLAVVIILGILMTVGGVAVTRITENTRKDTFINTAQEYAEAAKKIWFSEGINCGTENNVPSDLPDGEYYILIDSKNNEYNYLLEKGGKSPWGNRDLKGYVKVIVKTINGKKKETFYVAITDGIHGITDAVKIESLKRGNLLTNLDKNKKLLEEITTLPFEPNKVTTCGIGVNHTGENGLGVAPTKKSKFRVVSGDKNNLKNNDELALGNEHFYIINISGSQLSLFAKNNLYVGGDFDINAWKYTPYNEKATGIQDESLNNSNSNIRKGAIQRQDNDTNMMSDETLNKYLNNYKKILIQKGVTINNIRLISKEDLINLGCTDTSGSVNCTMAPNYLKTSSYWTSHTARFVMGYGIMDNGNFDIKDYSNYYSLRPVIEITKEMID